MFGFATASNKQVVVSADALAHARNLLADADGEHNQAKTATFYVDNNISSAATAKTTPFGFTTASNKTVRVSEQALLKARTLFRDNDDEEEEPSTSNTTTDSTSVDLPTTSTGFVGFQSASGKAVGVSDAALEKARRLFCNVDDDNDQHGDSKEEEDNNKVSTSRSPLVDQNSHLPVLPTTGFGFQSAAGTSININPESLAKARALFRDDDETSAAHNSTGEGSPTSAAVNHPKTDTSNETRKFVDRIRPDAVLRQSRVPQQETPRISGFGRTPYRPPRRVSDNTPKRRRVCAGGSPRLQLPSTSHADSVDEIADMLDSSPVFGPRKAAPATLRSQNSKRPFSTRHAVCLERKLSLRSADMVDRKPGAIKRIRKEHNQIPMLQYVGLACPEKYSENQLLQLGVRLPTIRVTSKNAANFIFTPEYFQFSDSDATSSERRLRLGENGAVLKLAASQTEITRQMLYRCFCDMTDVDPNLVSARWFTNHYRWIVWKLASLECKMPLFFAKQQLTPERVMHQIKYRYDREIDAAERSALHKIAEGDGVCSRPMVLMVASIVRPAVVQETHDFVAECSLLELSDGWYSIKAVLDQPLSRLQHHGDKIVIGTKLFITRCTLVGRDGDGCHPLDLPTHVQLSIDYNSVRRAHWNARLGYVCRIRDVPMFPLLSLNQQGGLVAAVRLVVCRTYAVKYIERCDDGRVCVRGEREEQAAVNAFEHKAELAVQLIADEVTKRMKHSMGSQETESDEAAAQHDASSVEDLYRTWRTTTDPEQFQAGLSWSQLRRLEDYCIQLRDNRVRAVQDEFDRVVREKRERNEMPTRQVSRQMRVRVASLHPADIQALDRECMLMIYDAPSDDLNSCLREGNCVQVENVMVGVRSNKQTLYLTANKRTRFVALNQQAHLDSGVYQQVFVPRHVTSLATIFEQPPIYNEVDLVGIVTTMRRAVDDAKGFVFHLCDDSFNFVVVRFYASANHMSSSDSSSTPDASTVPPACVRVGKCVALVNLVPTVRFVGATLQSYVFSDNTHATGAPRMAHLIHDFERLNAVLEVWVEVGTH